MVLSSGLQGRALYLANPRKRDLLFICSTYRLISLSSFSAFFFRRAASIRDLFEFILFLISFDSTISFLVCSLTSYPNWLKGRPFPGLPSACPVGTVYGRDGDEAVGERAFEIDLFFSKLNILMNYSKSSLMSLFSA